MPMSYYTVTNSCRVHPFGLHLEVSCPDFLLAWEIAMEGKYDIEHTSLRLEGEYTLIEDHNEYFNLKGMLMIEFASPKDPRCDDSRFNANDGDNKDCKGNVLSLGSCFDSYITSPTCMFPYMCGVVYHEISPLEEEITLRSVPLWWGTCKIK